MAKPYGKNINLHKKDNKRPSNNKRSPRELDFISKTNNTTIKNDLYYRPYKFQVPRGEGETTTSFAVNNNRNPSYNNPFYLFLLDNTICQIKDRIKPGATTSINIANPTGHLGINLLRKGDYFWIYDRRTYRSIKLQADADLADNATNITIVSKTFTINDKMIAGSLVVPDYKVQTQRLSNVPNFKKYELTQSQYQNLNTSPLVLLPAQSNILHIPLSATLVYKHDSDESTRAD